MAQGYAKIEGKPMAMICHGVVGLQHATMAMYNAWCDRVPVIVHGRQHHRGRTSAMPGAEWVHSAIDLGAHRARLHQMGRPADLAAAFRRIGGARLQDRDHAADGPGDAVARRRAAGKSDRRCRDAAHPEARQGDPAAGRLRRRSPKPAKMLVAAENPVIICDRVARTPAGMAPLVELAETLQCAVIDNAGRMNFPSRHPLNQTFRRGARARPGRRDPGAWR